MRNGTSIEGATVGNEGMVGVQVFLAEGRATEDLVVEIPGRAERLPAALFRAATEASPALRSLLQQYTLALMNQLARTAGCNRHHSVGERCARWLLMTRDRAGTDTLPITHESLAGLLGTRRASVTQVAGQLKRAGLIDYRHGRLTILDAPRLERIACEDYLLTREAYDRVFG
jgi:CRP-like cAMP-binding protein